MMATWAIEPKNEYPEEWKDGTIQKAIAQNMGYHCEHCQAPIDPSTGYTIGKPRRDGREHVIAIHHIDGDKANCDWTNLLYCCQACHLEVQGAWGPGQMIPLKWMDRFNGPPEWIIKRGLPYVLHTQQKLF
jgi:hypothetical protein